MTSATWGDILKLLPPCIQNPTLLERLWSLDEQMRTEKATGALRIEVHYKNGVYKLTRITPSHIDFMSLTIQDT